MQRITPIFIFIFAFCFCLKDFIPSIVSVSDSESYAVDLNEENSSEKEGKDEKKEKEKSKINTSLHLSLLINDASQNLNLLFFTERIYIAPYFEILFPPPERV